MSPAVAVLSVKQPRSDCNQTVKIYGSETTEFSQWTIIKTNLKTLIGSYINTPPCTMCVFVCSKVSVPMKVVCAFVLVYN